MPVIVFVGIFLAVVTATSLFTLMFLSVALSGPERTSSQSTPLTQDQARDLFQRVSERRIDPKDGCSPTFGELVRWGHLEEITERSMRSMVR